jgi:hypothetical protein
VGQLAILGGSLLALVKGSQLVWELLFGWSNGNSEASSSLNRGRNSPRNTDPVKTSSLHEFIFRPRLLAQTLDATHLRHAQPDTNKSSVQSNTTVEIIYGSSVKIAKMGFSSLAVVQN